jgi:hypothetical protein
MPVYIGPFECMYHGHGEHRDRNMYGHGESMYGHGESTYGHGESMCGHGESMYGHGEIMYGHGESMYSHGDPVQNYQDTQRYTDYRDTPSKDGTFIFPSVIKKIISQDT